MHLAFLSFLFLSSAVSAAPPAPTVMTDEEIIEALIEGLDDTNVEVRMHLAGALAELGPQVIPRLIEAMASPNAHRRSGAAYALSQLRTAGRPAIPALVKALKDRDDGVRRNASYALQRILSASPASSVGVAPPVSLAPPPTKKIELPPLDPPPSDIPTGGSK